MGLWLGFPDLWLTWRSRHRRCARLQTQQCKSEQRPLTPYCGTCSRWYVSTANFDLFEGPYNTHICSYTLLHSLSSLLIALIAAIHRRRWCISTNTSKLNHTSHFCVAQAAGFISLCLVDMVMQQLNRAGCLFIPCERFLNPLLDASIFSSFLQFKAELLRSYSLLLTSCLWNVLRIHSK